MGLSWGEARGRVEHRDTEEAIWRTVLRQPGRNIQHFLPVQTVLSACDSNPQPPPPQAQPRPFPQHNLILLTPKAGDRHIRQLEFLQLSYNCALGGREKGRKKVSGDSRESRGQP